MSVTLRDKYISVLTAELNFELTASRSKKFVTLVDAKTGRRLYIGRAGSIRSGHSASESYPVDKGFKDKLLSIYGRRPTSGKRRAAAATATGVAATGAEDTEAETVK